jgi:hypothetical protein
MNRREMGRTAHRSKDYGSTRHPDAELAAGQHKLSVAMFLVMLLLLGLSLAFAPSEWFAECLMASIIVPGVILWIVEKYGDRFS